MEEMTVVRNLVPAKRNSDNVTGIYDLAHDVFYTSTTGTDFVAISF